MLLIEAYIEDLILFNLDKEELNIKTMENFKIIIYQQEKQIKELKSLFISQREEFQKHINILNSKIKEQDDKIEKLYEIIKQNNKKSDGENTNKINKKMKKEKKISEYEIIKTENLNLSYSRMAKIISNGNIIIIDSEVYILSKNLDLLQIIKDKKNSFFCVEEYDNNSLIFGLDKTLVIYELNSDNKYILKKQINDVFARDIKNFSNNMLGISSDADLKIYDKIKFTEKYSLFFRYTVLDFIQIKKDELIMIIGNKKLKFCNFYNETEIKEINAFGAAIGAQSVLYKYNDNIVINGGVDSIQLLDINLHEIIKNIKINHTIYSIQLLYNGSLLSSSLNKRNYEILEWKINDEQEFEFISSKEIDSAAYLFLSFKYSNGNIITIERMGRLIEFGEI